MNDGDGWVSGPEGQRWGRFGAAGLLLTRSDGHVLMQRRSFLVQNGGLWSIPGGARNSHETAAEAALREAAEECGVLSTAVRVVEERVLEYGWWSYTTVIADAVAPFSPIDSWEGESLWVAGEQVAELPLLPAFRATWAALRAP
ncbi:NUDIX domain-containing protein [Lacisediminihabitans sp. H27-G8]|uniref:NUDIX domain-containing protein n=1 Tax=Lacisediminihabitans sp. H27-G8 TaxID=3111909 RepID=UPI0038FC6213